MPFERGDLEQLYCECHQQLFTCALAVTESPARAEDAVHDAFCRLLSRQGVTEGSVATDLKAYVFRAVRNAAVDLVRQRGNSPDQLPDFVFDSRPDATVLTEDAEFRQQVVAVMNRLSPDERETIVQHVYGELTFEQIAAVRDSPLGTVVSWYRRGLEKLRRKLMEVADGLV